MIETYIPILVLIVVAIGLALLLIGLSRALGPFRPNAPKLGPYESGMDAYGQARERYSVSFYIIAMEFIVFDLEVVFIYPWAVQFRELGATSFWAMMIFITILFLGLIYTLKKGTLDWDLKKEKVN
ncbi:MAG: NADH-quinone oxidoreductase subunit A [Balneolales bacterium]